MTPSPLDGFAPQELNRYARHLALSEVGVEGQARLRAARVLLVGAGGLGSPAALYLAAAGVGTLGLADPDRVDLTNLQRQVLHGTGSVGQLKTDSAARALRELNPHIQIETHPLRLDSTNALQLLAEYDLVLDGSDNFPTRYLLNDACGLLGIPWIYGAILRWEGQLSLFGAPEGPCYRCLFREPPPADTVPGCAEAGVMGALPGVIGSLQALEAIKWIVGVGDGLSGRLLLFDALALSFREIRVRKDSECALCGSSPSLHHLIDYEHFCGTATPEPVDYPSTEGRDASGGPPVELVSSMQLLAELEGDAPLPLLVDVRADWEWRVSSLEALGAIHLPMTELLGGLELPAAPRGVVLYCRAGARSQIVARRLRDSGVLGIRVLDGGLEAWAREVDPELPVP